MLVYTLGLPLSIFVFLLVGAVFGSADPQAGLMPGLVAGIVVFSWLMSWQEKANNDLENPAPITVNCSPERAFSAVYDCLTECHINDNFWSIQPLQNQLKIVAHVRFTEAVNGGGQMITENRSIRLVASVQTTPAGKTAVSLSYFVHSPQGRWTCDDLVQLTTAAIKRELMAA